MKAMLKTTAQCIMTIGAGIPMLFSWVIIVALPWLAFGFIFFLLGSIGNIVQAFLGGKARSEPFERYLVPPFEFTRMMGARMWDSIWAEREAAPLSEEAEIPLVKWIFFLVVGIMALAGFWYGAYLLFFNDKSATALTEKTASLDANFMGPLVGGEQSSSKKADSAISPSPGDSLSQGHVTSVISAEQKQSKDKKENLPSANNPSVKPSPPSETSSDPEDEGGALLSAPKLLDQKHETGASLDSHADPEKSTGQPFLPLTPQEALPKTEPSHALEQGPVAASREVPFENSLGMRFVPVPKTSVLFCVHEVRRKDFAAFVEATGRTYKRVLQRELNLLTDDHAIGGILKSDAEDFCAWLSAKEARVYRLPSDHEWSCAVGLGDRESPSGSPEEKNCKIKGVFPWGVEFPPPPNVGNYNFADAYKDIAPVMEFAPNDFGIYDLGGNVSEWCSDSFRANGTGLVLRGAGFWVKTEMYCLSSKRVNPRMSPPKDPEDGWGIRCVLALPSDSSEKVNRFFDKVFNQSKIDLSKVSPF